MATGNENGIREAIDNLKVSMAMLIRKHDDIDKEGCLTGRTNARNIRDLEEEVKDLRQQMAKNKSQIDIWYGGLAVLIIVVPILVRIFFR